MSPISPNISRANLAASTVFHRLMAGMTRIELAAKAGVSVGTIRRLEEGNSDAIRLQALSDVARALDLCVTVKVIADETEPEAAPSEKAQLSSSPSLPHPDTQEKNS